MSKEEILGAFSLVNNPIVLSEEEVKDVQKAIKELQQENQKYKEVIDRARVLVNNVYNSLENADKPIKFYEEILDILNIDERN